jgi:NAD+ diphosphatase
MSKGFVPGVDPQEDRNELSWWFVFRGRELMVRLEENDAPLPLLASPIGLGSKLGRRHYLGRLNGRHCYSAEAAPEYEPPEGWTFHGLRHLLGVMSQEMVTIAGAAAQVVDWDRNNQYCGRCGAPAITRSKERAKECPECGLVSYPRISPAIIVLVERDGQLLLARSKRHTSGMYSVLAGFVEPGETLEQAVRREIREEVGLSVTDIRYFGSQPWPFPDSLMIAFTCRYESGEIRLALDEMVDAAWFTGDNLPLIPPRISIARQLIEWFLEKHGFAQG